MTTHASEMHALDTDHRKLGIWVFLASEVIFFAAIITTFLVYSGRPVKPDPKEILTLLVPAINTAVLLTSSVTMVLALQSIKEGRQSRCWQWLVATALLGIVFILLKGTEYLHLIEEGLTPSANIFGSIYYTLTGFHAAHVLVGVIWLLAVAAKTIRGGFSVQNNLPVEIAGLYWHFVDLVWVAIFMIVYLLEQLKFMSGKEFDAVLHLLGF